MASAAKPARKKFRVAVSGATVDGREIRPEHLRDAAANYSPDVYGARVNVEHYLSPFPGSDFGAMGDVTALSAEDISEGPLAGRTALYAEIEPSERMKKLTEEGKKIYSSIELHPQFALKRVLPADSDTPDVDDGDTTVSAGDFWPVIKLADLRLAARIAGGITTSRLMHVTTEAVAHVTAQLLDWRAGQLKAGFHTLEDVPSVLPSGEMEKLVINGENVKVYRFRRAVYSIARALVLEGYRDVDTTAKGDKDAAALDLQRDDLWRDARWSIADIRDTPRLYAELC